MLIETEKSILAIERKKARIKAYRRRPEVKKKSCGRCNKAIGLLKDNLEAARTLVTYLEGKRAIRD